MNPSPKKLLVIDDQIANFDTLVGFLESETIELVYASSGPKAFALLEKTKPDLILLDVMMPEMNGLEVCQRLKQDPRYLHIPILMVTALNTKSDLAHCLEEGADDFISKPFDRIELRARVTSLLRIKAQYDQLTHLIELREEALQNRENLSNMIVHDLRNPLLSMILGIEIVLKYVDKPDKQERMLNRLQQMLLSGKRLNNMINDLLLMAKLEAGKLSIQEVSTDLKEFSEQIISEFRAIANFYHVHLQANIPDQPHWIMIDEPLLQRIIDNLLVNAFKFSPSDGIVHLSIIPLTDKKLQVTVSDQGSGISDEKAGEIFQVFEVGETRKNVSQIGLGLAFCKMTVEAMGGTLTLAKNQPQGAVFTVTI